MRESRAENERLLNVIASVAGQLDLLHRATHAEAAARERQFRTLANSISQLAWMADSEGYIFWYNDRWYEYTAESRKVFQTCHLIHPDVSHDHRHVMSSGVCQKIPRFTEWTNFEPFGR